MRRTLKDSFITANMKSELNKISSLISCYTDISVYGIMCIKDQESAFSLHQILLE